MEEAAEVWGQRGAQSWGQEEEQTWGRGEERGREQGAGEEGAGCPSQDQAPPPRPADVAAAPWSAPP